MKEDIKLCSHNSLEYFNSALEVKYYLVEGNKVL